MFGILNTTCYSAVFKIKTKIFPFLASLTQQWCIGFIFTFITNRGHLAQPYFTDWFEIVINVGLTKYQCIDKHVVLLPLFYSSNPYCPWKIQIKKISAFCYFLNSLICIFLVAILSETMSEACYEINNY